MNCKKDVTLDLKQKRIKKDNMHLGLLKDIIKETLNPFDPDLNLHHLHNIGTRKAAKECTENFLLSVEENGEAALKKFLKECNAQTERFEQRIS